MASIQLKKCSHLVSMLLVVLFSSSTPLLEATTNFSELKSTWNQKYREGRFSPRLQWGEKDHVLFWKNKKNENLLIDLKTGKKSMLNDQALSKVKFKSNLLTPLREEQGPKLRGGQTTITFVNDLKEVIDFYWINPSLDKVKYGSLQPGEQKEQSTFTGHLWVGKNSEDKVIGIFQATKQVGYAHFNIHSTQEVGKKLKPKIKRPFQSKLKTHNIYGRDKKGQEFQITEDGTNESPYQNKIHWSPNGDKGLCFRVDKVEIRKIPIVESSPKDQVQPKLHWVNYRKPGDIVPQQRPTIIDFNNKTAIEVDITPFKDAYSINRIHWSKDGRSVYCVVNMRGHQQLFIKKIDATTGKVFDIITENSETFVDYSQKTYLNWLDDKQQLLWMSERDGWNHLYRFDQQSGKLINQITKGQWVVRKVEYVDHKKETIWFTAMGIYPEQDPYHQHLAKVNFDGTGLTILTEGDGTHEWEFSPTRQYFIDRWSRIDQPTITEVRDSLTGKLISELGRDNMTELLKHNFSFAQRFKAKGRDGKTDIWGVIFRPTNLKPGQSLPVIEQIYAGPHGHFVPKSWGISQRQRELAELGFLVVQIDGMGTNWRSKAFHDVCWQNLKDGGFPDRIAWMKAAAQQHPELDLDRVGIFGGSAGGQNALAALLHHGNFYKAAAADCGCHDNRMDKIWWNEAWMGKMGPHYADNSNVTHASKLKGKLFLTVGELDKNVDPASTLQVVDALIKADKDFDMILVPGKGHGVGQSPYMNRRRQNFFIEALH